mgnify:CR=1 FL=1
MNTNRIMNVSIIGCGIIHGKHAETLSKSRYTRLVSVVDINEERARESAEKYGCKYYTDYMEMMKDSSVDAVHICTPHYLHAPMAIEAMKKGKHVLTEKPMGISVHAAKEMLKISEETGKRLGVCFQNRYNNTSQRIKELLDSGTAGRVIGAKAFVTWHRDEKYYTESGWRGTWEKEGGGVLINQSIHTLDLLQWFLGDMDRIKGNTSTNLLSGIIEVEDTADAVIGFKSGAAALFYATNCYTANSPVQIEIICENAVFRLDNDLTITYRDGRTESVSEDGTGSGEKAYWGESHKRLIEDFYIKLLEGRSFPVDGKQGITALMMIEKIYASSKNREFVSFE